MKKNTILMVAVLSLVAGLAGACSSGATNTTTTNSTATSGNRNTTTAVNTTGANTTAPSNATTSGNTKTEEDAPASVKAAFPDAQSFSKSHKDIPKDAIADIEKDTGAKVPDTDHHSYLAFSTTGGARKQIGAAASNMPTQMFRRRKTAAREPRAARVSSFFGCGRRRCFSPSRTRRPLCRNLKGLKSAVRPKTSS